MRRREFIQKLAFIGSLAVMAKPVRSLAGETSHTKVVFHIAGSRFEKKCPALHEWDDLRIVSGTFDGQLCFSVCTRDGVRIGYVPKKVIPLLQQRRIVRSYLSRVDTFAFPWRRYEVTVVAKLNALV